ncbi:MAG: hypothetical protein AAGC73_03545 [Verrucomicrobiota bacterium]
MEYSINIYPEESLIIESVSGVITIEDFVHKTQELFANPLYNPKYCGLVDMRGATSQLSKVELYGFANFLNQSEQFGKARWAALADDPIVVAFGQVLQHRIIDENLIGIFSKLESAAEFIQKPALLKICE